MRAVVVGPAGAPELADVAEPAGEGALVRVRAVGLCGSDVEKLGSVAAGAVLGHEVVGDLADGRRVALVHHLPCGSCARCRAGHESTCERFAAATITPGGFAERVLATETIELPHSLDPVLGSYAEPLACVLRGAQRVPRGRILVVGYGFIGRLFAAVLRRRGDDVFVIDTDPARAPLPPNGPVDAAVLCAPGGGNDAAARLEPGGALLAFASAGPLDLDAVYRRELTVTGSRSATPRHMREAIRLLAVLDLPEPTVLPLERFAEGLELYRSRRAVKVVFTP